MEIVRACLRVLKHHGVIALCDMFFYSNRYEFTERATSMLAGHETKLLMAATEHAIRSTDIPSPREGSPSLHAMASSPATEGSMSSGSRTVEWMQPGNARLMAQPSTPSLDVYVSSSLRKGEIHDLKMAVAEFYTRCERKRSFGDTWMSLVSSSNNSSTNLRTGNENSAPAIDWKRAFRLLDHRRLVTFGVVHGLIRRIHRVPRILETSSTDSVPQRRPPQRQASDADSGQSNNSHIRLGPLLQVQRHSSGGSSHSRRKTNAATIASKMDGLHCDDELVCEFQKSFDELLEIVPDHVSIALVPATF